jgi:hypothetical protein
VSTATAQERVLAKPTKTQTFKTLTQTYINHLECQDQLVLKNGEDWWQPDSALYHTNSSNPNILVIYEYDESGNKKYVTQKQSSTHDDWINNEIYCYEYFEDNKLKICINKIFNSVSGEWVNQSKDTYTYEDNKLIYILSEIWQDNAWRNFHQLIYKYDNQNNLTHELSQYYVDDNWWDSKQYIYTYDDRKNLLSDTEQYWDYDEWRNRNVYNYGYDNRNNLTLYMYEREYNYNLILDIYYESKYDDNNNEIECLYKTRHSGSNVLKNSKLHLLHYDNNNNCTEIEGFTYNTSDEWSTSTKTIYTYNDNNNCTSEIEYNWSNNAWVNFLKIEYFYYPNYSLSYYILSIWFSTEWMEFRKQEYVYDIHNNVIENIIMDNFLTDGVKYVYEFDDNNNGIKEELFFGANNTWWNVTFTANIPYNNNMSVFNSEYSCIHIELSYTKTPKPAGIEEVGQSTQEITIYPNPSKDYINISVENDEIENVQIYNLTGKLVKQEKSNKININDLPTGMYIIKVETDSGNCIKKVIKD